MSTWSSWSITVVNSLQWNLSNRDTLGQADSVQITDFRGCCQAHWHEAINWGSILMIYICTYMYVHHMCQSRPLCDA